MHKILVSRLYFPLDAVQVSDCVSPSTGAKFLACTSHLVYASTIRVAVVWLITQQPHVWYRRITTYTKCDVQLINLLLIMDQYSPKHVEHLMENKV